MWCDDQARAICIFRLLTSGEFTCVFSCVCFVWLMGAMKRAGANAAGDGFRGETCECLNRHSRYRPRSKCVCVCVNKMLDHYHQLRRQQTAALWRLMKVYIYKQIIEWTKQRLCQIDEDVIYV